MRRSAGWQVLVSEPACLCVRFPQAHKRTESSLGLDSGRAKFNVGKKYIHPFRTNTFDQIWEMPNQGMFTTVKMVFGKKSKVLGSSERSSMSVTSRQPFICKI